MNVEGVSLFRQNSSSNVENASIEELENCHFYEERSVHVGLGEISFDFGHEDQEKWEDSVENCKWEGGYNIVYIYYQWISDGILLPL